MLFRSISDSIGCIATSNIITISGQNELNTISDFTVYPNPGNGTFNIAINNLSLSGTSTFSLINNVGQCVYKSTLSSLITKFELTLAEGIYMAEVENDKVVIRKKLIVKY